MKHKKRIKIAQFIALILCFVVLTVAILKLDDMLPRLSGSEQTASEVQEQLKTVYFFDEAYLPKEDISNLLIIGLDDFGELVDSGSYNNTQQADFLLLLSFNHKDKTYSAFHINRDTMTDVEILGVTGAPAGERVQQIALAHTYGNGLDISCRNTVKAVSNLLYDVKIDGYFAITMDAVSIINDSIGGVGVTVNDDMTVVDPRLVMGQSVKLDGDLALKYIRARMALNDSSNISRMRRQQQYLNAFVDKLSVVGASSSLATQIYNKAADYTLTNCTVSELQTFFDYTAEYTKGGFYSPEGTAKAGDEFMEFYVDEIKLQKLVAEKFYDKKK